MMRIVRRWLRKGEEGEKFCDGEIQCETVAEKKQDAGGEQDEDKVRVEHKSRKARAECQPGFRHHHVQIQACFLLTCHSYTVYT